MAPNPDNNDIVIRITPATWHDIQQAAFWPAFSDSGTPQETDIATLAERYNDLVQLAIRLRDTPTMENTSNSRCQCKALTSQIKHLEAEISALKEEALDYTTNLDTLRSALETEKKRANNQETIATTLAQNIQPNGNRGRTQRMPDPEKFDGNTDQIEPFEGKLYLKLSERDSFPDEQAKLRYTIGLLTGKALDSVSHLIRPSGVQLNSVEELLLILRSTFADPDPIGTAERRVEQLKQGNCRFPEYYASMKKYLNRLGWDEDAQWRCIYRGLTDEWKDKIADCDNFPESLDDRVAWCMRRDQRKTARQQEKHQSHAEGGKKTFLTSSMTNRSPPPYSRKPTTQSTNLKNYETTPVEQKPATHPTATNSGYYGPAPMDISSIRKKRLNPEERLRRLAEGLCLYCGHPGHMARECRQASERTRLTAHAISTKYDDMSVGEEEGELETREELGSKN